MRSSGILMHISSLPGKYGIGKMGKEAFKFVDFLKKSGQSVWQILPLAPTSYGDSPYQSFSINAGNPYFIDFESLEKDGLLEHDEYTDIDWGNNMEKVDYGIIYENIFKVLKKAHNRFRQKANKEFAKYVFANNDWIYDYGLFMALKFAHNGKAWYEWEEPLKFYKPKAVKQAMKKYADDINFWCFLQFVFDKQWHKLKDYANKNGIRIIGDIPIYVALDSVDVWTKPELFCLDKNKMPTSVAGCPPDDFSKDGQLWGNPLYRWDVMAKDKYKWWVGRIKSAFEMYDTVRIDHFRGFESYYTIAYGNKTAKKGKWKKGPGMKLFKEIKKQLGEVDIIAEDLGFLTKHVVKMLEASGYPGMKVLEFAFDPSGESDYLPHNFKTSNSVCYTGTHDNETIAGWIGSCDKETAIFCREYLGASNNAAVPWAMIKLCWASICDTAVAQMQDILGLDNSARMNTPSTVGENWQWRLKSLDTLDNKLSEKLLKLTKIYGRLPAVNKKQK